MTVHECPKCSRPIGAPLSSGRQVCAGCGWASHSKVSETQKRAAGTSIYPNTPRNLLFYGVGVLVALLAALYSSDGYRLTCERSLSTQGGVCRITQYNYLGKTQMVRGFPSSSLVSAQLHEERRVRRRRRRSDSSYTLYHLILTTKGGEITTPLSSRNRHEIETDVQQVQRFTSDPIQTLLKVDDRGTPMTTAAIFIGGGSSSGPLRPITGSKRELSISQSKQLQLNPRHLSQALGFGCGTCMQNQWLEKNGEHVQIK
ncbi:hypothetical protein [Leptolyngbya sp. FACHB-16]|nr:hypothetical protein [Leptolyngbya sp. FACHB-16]MBD1910379.1 hypothetical protein [Leptolyngbya sp. FACHB-8]MBD2155307.1 hypothetical protein [Leptolyngbya sp. FACHB-16]